MRKHLAVILPLSVLVSCVFSGCMADAAHFVDVEYEIRSPDTQIYSIPVEAGRAYHFGIPYKDGDSQTGKPNVFLCENPSQWKRITGTVEFWQNGELVKLKEINYLQASGNPDQPSWSLPSVTVPASGRLTIVLKGDLAALGNGRQPGVHFIKASLML